MKPIATAALACLASLHTALDLRAQESAHYQIEESVLNAAGHPADGVAMTSGSFRLSLDALGDPLASGALASSSFAIGGGFASAYPAPGEVGTLRFTDARTLVWTSAPSAGDYDLYRGTLAKPQLDFGACLQAGITGTMAIDPGTPPPLTGWFYLVTVRNTLREEGPMGTTSAGAPRSNNAPCP